MIVRKMPRIAVIALSTALLISSNCAARAASKEAKSQAKSPANMESSSATAEKSVRSKIQELSRAISDGNAKTISMLWSEDGEYLASDGSQSKGRQELENRFNEIAANNDHGQIDLLTDEIKFISPDVAIARGVVRRNNGTEGPEPETRFSIIFSRKSGNWFISQASEHSIMGQADEEPLKELSWLVGDWSAENKGASVKMQAQWAPNKNFIICSYRVKSSDESKPQESRQIIGWDPRSEHPVSWQFDSTGGFGYGDWYKKGADWRVESNGVARDGSTTSATNIISKADSGTFTWQSVNRVINGMALADTLPISVQRSSR